MAKAKLAIAAVFLAVLSTSAAAAPAAERGCTVLAQRVEASVLAAAGSPGLPGQSPRPARGAGAAPLVAPQDLARHTCGATAAVASRAFTEAVSGLGVSLSWTGGWLHPGDTCLGHYLSQCYPTHDPWSALPAPDTFSFVQRAWQRVVQALVSQMPYGPRGDLTHFSDDSLAEALGRELRTLKPVLPARKAFAR